MLGLEVQEVPQGPGVTGGQKVPVVHKEQVEPEAAPKGVPEKLGLVAEPVPQGLEGAEALEVLAECPG